MFKVWAVKLSTIGPNIMQVIQVKIELEMWEISDALPVEATRAPSPSVSTQSGDARLSYCDFTDFSPEGA